MKKFAGSFLAGLFVAVAASFLFSRQSRTTRISADQRESDDELLPETESMAAEMREEFETAEVQAAQPRTQILDLNTCSLEELLAIGDLDVDWAMRIVESRPYRNKLDLLSRMVIPIDIFNSISGRVSIAKPNESVKIA